MRDFMHKLPLFSYKTGRLYETSLLSGERLRILDVNSMGGGGRHDPTLNDSENEEKSIGYIGSGSEPDHVAPASVGL